MKKANEDLISVNNLLEQQLNNNNNPSPSLNTIQSLTDKGLEVMQLIKDKDMVGLSNHVHPTKGVRITPYVHINNTFDQVFSPQEVEGLSQDATVYNWGYYYGGGNPEINLNFNDYYDEFIYDEDFLNANIVGVNSVVSYGDMIDNIFDEHPNDDYLEFYISGTPHNNGTYWRSLKLVFENDGGVFHLIGIIHGQWTDVYGVD